MKIKALLFTSLLLASVGCSKDEPLIRGMEDWESMLDSWGGTWEPGTRMKTPKGWAAFNYVKREDLPAWLRDLTDDITQGYIMRGGSGDQLLYFVYDTAKEYGRHYDADGNAVKDNPALNDWVIIYQWAPPTLQ